MLILLSPAKSLDFETPAPTKKAEVPRFLDEQTTALAGVLKKKKAGDLAELMGLSKGLASLNYQRYQGFDPDIIHQQVGKPNSRKDEILPYRLEMGTKLKTPKGKDLYEFWGSAITEALAEENPDWICNLASAEYYKSVVEAQLPCPVVHPAFKDESKGEYKVMGLFAKYARGLMSRWIVDNNVKKPGELSGFNVGGYRYNKEESTDLKPVFKRAASAR